MIRGLYTACSGMMLQMTRQDTLANNLANANTTGFKKDTVISQDFPSLLITRMGETMSKPQKVGSLGTGTAVQQIVTDYSVGAYTATGNSFDLALGSDCFFSIETAEGICYSRNGAFSVDSEGRLVNANGQPVLGAYGHIYVDGPFVVDEQGNVLQDGEIINTLDIVRFSDKSMLVKIGDDLFAAGDQEAEIPVHPRVLQGHLESSNVNPVKEMVDLITVVRAYEVMQKVIQAEDQTLDKLINQAGSR